MPSATAHVHCRADAGVPLAHTWERTVGSGHATLALRADIHGVAKRAWIEMGEPQKLHPTEVAALESASALAKEVASFETWPGELRFTVSMAPQSPALLTLELA